MENLSVKLYNLLTETFSQKESILCQEISDFSKFREDYENTCAWLPQLDGMPKRIFDDDDNIYCRVIKSLGIYEEFISIIKDYAQNH